MLYNRPMRMPWHGGHFALWPRNNCPGAGSCPRGAVACAAARMSANVAIVDYGIGNLLSVRRALEHCGASVMVSNDPRVLLDAPRLVLPGVGAFAAGMQALVQRNLDACVVEFTLTGKPLLGICRGMQLLATVGMEFGEHLGLGIIPGRVEAIPSTSAAGRPHKVPHIGWTGITVPKTNRGWAGTILHDVVPGANIYLVHSSAVHPSNDVHRLADFDYNGRTISAAIQKDNVCDTQFHPETSCEVGLAILRRYLAT